MVKMWAPPKRFQGKWYDEKILVGFTKHLNSEITELMYSIEDGLRPKTLSEAMSEMTSSLINPNKFNMHYVHTFETDKKWPSIKDLIDSRLGRLWNHICEIRQIVYENEAIGLYLRHLNDSNHLSGPEKALHIWILLNYSSSMEKLHFYSRRGTTEEVASLIYRVGLSFFYEK